MSAGVPQDDLRTSVARIIRSASWTILILLILAVGLHLAGVMVLPPLVAMTAIVLFGVTQWHATLVERGREPGTRLVAVHLVLVAGITFLNHLLGGMRFPAGTLFYVLVVANSGFSAPQRYLLANLSAAAYGLLIWLEHAGIVPQAPGAFPAEMVPVPAWPAQMVFFATFAVSLNLLAVITQRLLELLELSRQRLAQANVELEGWRLSLADQVRERTAALEAANVELDARARALQERSHRLRTFVYTVTHDLKTPVNNVLLLSDLLLAREGQRLGDESRRDLERIAQLASRTEHMIQDIFALFQITSAQEPPAWTALDDVARRALDDLGPQIAAKRIAVDVEPLPWAWAAPGKLRHVLSNLLANAVKHVPPDHGTIVVSGREDAAGVRLSVRDNGIGIAPEYHDHIFKLFGRVPQPDPSADGTGVGLAIVRGLMEEHRGRVWVESAPGTGSTFHVELPTPTHARPLRTSAA